MTTIHQPPALSEEARKRVHPSVLARHQLERRVVWNLCKHLEAAGFHPYKANDGDETFNVRTHEDVMEAVFAVDECAVSFKKEGFNSHDVVFVLGNDGWDAISDWGSYGDDRDGFAQVMDDFNPEACI